MRTPAPIEDFEIIWQAASRWEKATFIAMTPGAVLEYMGKLPSGSHGHGMFNLHQDGIPLGGHLMIKQLGSIWFLSKPHFGKESHSIQFYTKEGKPMFALYVGRGEDKELLPEVLHSYQHLRASYQETAP
jgi:heme iron utilization protein